MSSHANLLARIAEIADALGGSDEEDIVAHVREAMRVAAMTEEATKELLAVKAQFAENMERITRIITDTDPWKAHLAGNPLARKLNSPGQCVEVMRQLILAQLAQIVDVDKKQ